MKKTQQFHLRLNKDDKELIDKMAKKNKKNMSEYIRSLIYEDLNREESSISNLIKKGSK